MKRMMKMHPRDHDTKNGKVAGKLKMQMVIRNLAYLLLRPSPLFTIHVMRSDPLHLHKIVRPAFGKEPEDRQVPEKDMLEVSVRAASLAP